MQLIKEGCEAGQAWGHLLLKEEGGQSKIQVTLCSSVEELFGGTYHSLHLAVGGGVEGCCI